MKVYTILIFLLFSFLLIACSSSNSKQDHPDEDDFKILHLFVERTKTDTARKHILDFYREHKIPVTAEELSEGHYQAQSPYDDYQYRHLISFDVKENKFQNIEYDEVRVDGSSKTADEVYCKKMNEHEPGSAPDISYERYENQLQEKQNILEMDAISGATYSMYRFQLVAAKAIAKKLE